MSEFATTFSLEMKTMFDENKLNKTLLSSMRAAPGQAAGMLNAAKQMFPELTDKIDDFSGRILNRKVEGDLINAGLRNSATLEKFKMLLGVNKFDFTDILNAHYGPIVEYFDELLFDRQNIVTVNIDGVNTDIGLQDLILTWSVCRSQQIGFYFDSTAPFNGSKLLLIHWSVTSTAN